MAKLKTSRTKIHVARDYFVISAAHFAVRSDGSTEPLHGHNYTVNVEVSGEVDPLGFIVDFSVLKSLIQDVVQQLNHRIILPALCGEIDITQNDDKIVVRTRTGKSYEFPESDVALLQIRNSTVEVLAGYLVENISSQLANSVRKSLDSIQVRVEESPGQGATLLCRF